MLFPRTPLSFALSLAVSAMSHHAVAQSDAAAAAQDTPLLTVVVVGSAEPTQGDPGSVTLDAATLLPMRVSTSDTASLLRDVPGVSLTASCVLLLPLRGVGIC